ncbi:MAG: Crp/Fnr family transcriptional regulator [Oscillospiraceae bacterium]|nr:Crp/Fnr family transcriptional regulator [Oscillospiraceae bacterium]
MKEYIDILKRTKLFFGVREDDIFAMLDCLDAKLSSFQKGETVLQQGKTLNSIPVLVKGKLHIQNEDYWGNRSILGSIDVGEMFGEAYAAPESGTLLNDVVAVEDSTVIFFDIKRILTTCSSACRFHAMVVQNLFFAVCEKNRKLVQKLGHMSKRTTREKLISYLSEEAKKHNRSHFEISFNRQQLADFLSVDRSAMSNELCKMRDEGLIAFHKNRFELKEKSPDLKAN